MKKRGLILLSLIFCGFNAALAQRAPAGDVEAKVDAYVKPYLEMKAFSGSILIAREGKVVFSKGYGMANYELSVANTDRKSVV